MNAVLAAAAVGLLLALLQPAHAPARPRTRRGAAARAPAVGGDTSAAATPPRGTPSRDARRRPGPARMRIAQADAAREHLTRAAALLRSGATPAQAFAALADPAGDGGPVADPAPGRRAAPEALLASQLERAWCAAATCVALALRSGDPVQRREPTTTDDGGHGIGESWERLRWVCGMAARTGAPLAPLLERLAADAAATADALRAREAGAAAAGTTRKVLAWLPVGGLVLAQSLGARPVEVLVGTAPGRITAALGCAFWVIALLWSRRVIRMPAARPSDAREPEPTAGTRPAARRRPPGTGGPAQPWGVAG